MIIFCLSSKVSILNFWRTVLLGKVFFVVSSIFILPRLNVSFSFFSSSSLTETVPLCMMYLLLLSKFSLSIIFKGQFVVIYLIGYSCLNTLELHVSRCQFYFPDLRNFQQLFLNSAFCHFLSYPFENPTIHILVNLMVFH
jgi:hypothetical protein